MGQGFFSPLELTTSRRDLLTLVPACGACKLNKKCLSPKMLLDGKGGKQIMVIGEAPGREEDEQGRPFVGKAGKYLRDCLEGTGIDLRKDCWTTNALRCRPKDNVIDNDNKISFCRPNVIRDIKEKKPEVIILLGGSAIKSVIGWLWKEDVGNMTRWMGWQIPSQELNCWICPTYHPSHVMRQEEEWPNEKVLKMFFRRHLQAAVELEGRPWKNVPDYKSKVEVILSPKEALWHIHEVLTTSEEISFDYETTCLKPDSKHASIYACSLSNGKKTIAYPWTKETSQATAAVLRSDIPKFGYNIKFESRWTRRKLGFWVKNWRYDGMIGAHVRDNRSGITSLKFQAFVNLGVGGYDAAIKPYLKSVGSNLPNRIREAPMAKVLEYCALDSLLEYKLCKMQMGELT